MCVCVVVVVVYNSVARNFLREIKFGSYGASKSAILTVSQGVWMIQFGKLLYIEKMHKMAKTTNLDRLKCQ